MPDLALTIAGLLIVAGFALAGCWIGRVMRAPRLSDDTVNRLIEQFDADDWNADDPYHTRTR